MTSLTAPVHDDVELLIHDQVWLEDLCHEYEYSILFLIVVTVMGLSFALYAVFIYSSRHHNLYYGCDVLNSLCFASAAIKFCPRIWQSLTVHGHTVATQSGCKLMAFTETGMNHVVSLLVVSNVYYAWVGCLRADFGWIDCRIRRHLGWIVLLVFALEGVFGMMPAIFTDVSYLGPDGSESICNSTQSVYLFEDAYVAGYIMLESVLPFMLPSLIMIYPLTQLNRIRRCVSDQLEKSIVKSTLVSATLYMVLNLPVACMTIIVVAVTHRGLAIDVHGLCVAEGVLRFCQEVWFVVTPLLLVFGDPEWSKRCPHIHWLPFFNHGPSPSSLCNVHASSITKLQDDYASNCAFKLSVTPPRCAAPQD